MPTIRNENTGTSIWTGGKFTEFVVRDLINRSEKVDRVRALFDADDKTLDITLTSNHWAWLTLDQTIELRDMLTTVIDAASRRSLRDIQAEALD